MTGFLNLSTKKIKRIHKVLSFFVSFSLILQLFSGVFLYGSALAREKLKSEIAFDKDKSSFNLSVNTSEEVDYLLAYRADLQTEVVKGEDKNEGESFSKEIYAGTCSTGEVCIPHNVLWGILKIEVRSESWLISKKFTVDNGELNLIEESIASSISLTGEENNWLINPNQTEIERECLADQSIKNSVNENWNIDNEKGIAETKEKVKLGVKYIFPLENKVSVTFNCLPKDESLRTSLKIQQIKVSDLKLPDDVNPATEYAYDITTDMQDGTFEYDISLPLSKNLSKNTTIKYAENADDLENIKEVEEEKNIDSDKVIIKGLNHLTIFIIDDGDSGYTDNGWNLYGSGGCGNNDHKWVQSSQTGKTATWTLPVGAPAGKYLIKVNWTTWDDHATNAHYQVYKDSSLIYTSPDINQKLKANGSSAPNGTCSEWYTLGSFDLSAEDYVKIGVEDGTTNGNLVADSVMFLLAPTITYPANGSYKTTAALDKIDWADSAGTYPAFTYKYESYKDENYTVLAYTSSWLSASEIPTPGTAEGTYYLRVKARDDQGNETEWSNGPTDPYKIIVDNTPPLINFEEPLSGSLHAETIHLKATCGEECSYVNFWWRAEAEAYDPGSKRYHYVYGNSTNFEWDLDSKNAQRWDGSTYLLNDGIYYLYAAGKDLAGNWARTPDIQITIDNTSPTIVGLTVDRDYVKAGDVLTIIANVTDSSGISAVSADFSYNPEYTDRPSPTSVGMTKIGGDTYSVNYVVPSSWNEGIMYIKVAARDMTGGNWARGGEMENVIVDNTPPQAPTDLGFNIPPGGYTVPRPGVEVMCDGYVNQNSISHHWSDESASGAVEYQRQWKYPGSSVWQGAENWNTPYTNYRSFGGGGGTEGLWHVRVRARDEAGNWSGWSSGCAVTFDKTSPTKPSGLGIYKTHNPTGSNYLGCGSYTNDRKITIDWSANPEGDIDFYWFGTKFNPYHKKVYSPDTHYFGNMTPGNNPYYYTVIAVDKAGNESPISDQCGLILDQDAPDVEITSPTGAVLFGTVPIRGTVLDENLWRYWLVIQNNSEVKVAGPGTVYEDNEFVDKHFFDWDTTTVPNGEYTIKLEARDKAKNKNSDSIDWMEVTVDNTGSISGVKFEDVDANGQRNSGEPGLLGWTIERKDVAGQLIDSTTTDGNGNYSFNDVLFGNYYVCEIEQSGWLRTQPGDSNCQEVVVNPGEETAGIDFGNFELGEITVCKYEDLNGDGELGGEPLMDGVLMTLYRQGEGWIQVGEPQETVEGCTTFAGLSQGNYQVEERVPEGYYNTTPILSDIITINSGISGIANFLNTQYGRIMVCKYDDYNGDGIPDDGEPGIDGVEISLGEQVGITGDGENEQGCFVFEDLTLGDYTVVENTDSDVLAGYLPSDGTETSYDVSLTESGQEASVDFFNELQPIILELDKTHDKVGLTASPGDVLNFTLTLTNTADSTAYGVVARDTLPDGFSYNTGTAQADGVSSEPTISGQELIWDLGDLTAGQIVEITYSATIDSGLPNGSYPNVSVASGTNRASDPDNETSYSNFAFVYTAVGVGISYTTSIGGAPAVLGAAIGPEGEVLGAATGSPTILLIIALLMIGLGLMVLFYKKARKFFLRLLKLIPVFIVALFAFANLTFAQPLIDVKSVDMPDYINYDPFEISYTAVEASGDSITVTAYLKKEGDSYQEVGTSTSLSDTFTVDGGILSGDGLYKIYFKAVSSSETVNSDEESFTIDRQAPGPVSDYKKERKDTFVYKVCWENPDEDDFDRVVIYRSDEQEFQADGSTQIAEVGGGKNEEKCYENGIPESKDYYYVLRVVDHAGNISGVVGDIPASSTTGVLGETTGATGAAEGNQVVLPEVGDKTTVGDQEGEEETEEGELGSGESIEITDEGEFRLSTWQIVGIIIVGGGLIILIIYFFLKKKE